MQRASAGISPWRWLGILPLSLILGASACASSKDGGGTSNPDAKGEASDDDGEDPASIGKDVDMAALDPAQAAQIVTEFRTQYALPAAEPSGAAIDSMAKVLEIVRADATADFNAARDFALEQQGAAALAIRGYLELTYADALLTAAALLEETRKREATTLEQLATPDPTADEQRAAERQAKADEKRTKVADLAKAVAALQLLAQAPLDTGKSLADEAIRQDPGAQLAYIAAANHARLRKSWLDFDKAMQLAEAKATDSPAVLTFLRAMEASERNLDPAKCDALLRQALEQRPDFVRAQVNLLLLQTSTDARYRELQRLEEMSPNHIVVRLAGPMIKNEYETAQALGGAS